MSRSGFRGRALTAAVAATVSLGLAGCGGSSTSSTSASTSAVGTTVPSSTAVAPATSSPTAASRPVAASMAELSKRITAAAKAKGTARLTSESSGGAAATRSTGVQRFGRSGLEFSVTTTAGGRSVKMIYTGGAAYMNVGEKYQGKSWLRITAKGKDPLSKALAPLFTQLSTSLDVGSQVGAAQGSTITGSTRTEFEGRPVTKYTVVQSEQAFMAQLEKFAATPELRAQLRKQFKGASSETQLWIGDDDLPVRYDSRVVGGSAPGTTTTVTYSDWGKPVTISAPPRGDVVDLGA